MIYIRSDSTDPHYNLALEQYVFDVLDPRENYFMLWQNDNTIVVGKHQNTVAEINAPYVKERGITVVRRLSGGGAVYHDMGNLNFTFIVGGHDGETFDFATFCRPVQQALAGLGVQVDISGRNDMTIGGKKFSGNAQYMKRGRVMHHGTLMYDSNLETVAGALQVSKDKIESKGVASVRSRVTNIRPHMREDLPIAAFIDALRDAMYAMYDMKEYPLSAEDCAAVRAIQAEVYDKWEWNYGQSPAYSIRKQRRIEGCGGIEVFIDVGKEGVIRDVKFYGDFFGNGDPAELAARLAGAKMEEASLREALVGVEVGGYFHNLDEAALLQILLQ